MWLFLGKNRPAALASLSYLIWYLSSSAREIVIKVCLCGLEGSKSPFGLKYNSSRYIQWTLQTIYFYLVYSCFMCSLFLRRKLTKFVTALSIPNQPTYCMQNQLDLVFRLNRGLCFDSFSFFYRSYLMFFSIPNIS